MQKNFNKGSKVKKKHKKAPYPHYRYYHKSKHPALILGEEKIDGTIYKDKYKFRRTTHKATRFTNPDVIFPNPNPKDTKPMYISKKIEKDRQFQFDRKPQNW